MTTPADLPLPKPSRAPAAARRRRPLAIALIILVVVLAVGSVGYLVAAPRVCALAEPERHGLPCDAPLPAGARFVSEAVSPPALATQTWVFTISPPHAASAEQAYVDRLRQSGWSCVFNVGSPDNFIIGALKGDTQLVGGGKPLLGPPARSITFTIDLIDTRSTGLKPPC